MSRFPILFLKFLSRFPIFFKKISIKKPSLFEGLKLFRLLKSFQRRLVRRCERDYEVYGLSSKLVRQG